MSINKIETTLRPISEYHNMEAIRYIKAVEILEAIEFAKKKNPKDVRGLNAVQIDVANQRSIASVTYIPIKVNVLNGKDADGKPKREWLDLHLMFRKVNTRSNITPYDDRIQQDNKGVTLQIRKTSKSYWVNPATKQEEEDPIGEALDQLDSIIQAKIAMHLKTEDESKKINHDIQKINMFVQRDMKDKKTKKVLKQFEDPIIRIEVKFRPKEKGAAVLPSALPWQCVIHDANKPRSRETTPRGEPPYEYATVDSGEGTAESRINFGNIHRFITAGSSITGYINASQLSLSMFGISLTPRFTSLIVKRSLGFAADYTAMTGQLDDLGDAKVESYEDQSGSGAGTGSGSKANKDRANYANDANDFGEDGEDGENGAGGAGGDDDDLNAGVEDDELPDAKPKSKAANQDDELGLEDDEL